MEVTGTIASLLHGKGATLWSVPPDTTVFDAISLMAGKNIGALLVMNGDTLVGLVSERDYTRKVALQGKSSKQTLVREIISSPTVVATRTHTVAQCMRLMTEHRVRHLPVLEGSRVIGLVSIGDLVNWTISAQDMALDQLEGYITGKYPG